MLSANGGESANVAAQAGQAGHGRSGGASLASIRSIVELMDSSLCQFLYNVYDQQQENGEEERELNNQKNHRANTVIGKKRQRDGHSSSREDQLPELDSAPWHGDFAH